MLGTLSLGILVDLDVTDGHGVLIEGSDIRRIGVGERVDVLESPESGVTSPRTLSVLVRHTGDTDGLLVHGNEGSSRVEQVERVTELHVLRAVLLADVERRADFLHLFLGAQRPETLELGIVEG